MRGTFVYGLVDQHKDLVHGYVRVHGGGWYRKDDHNKTMSLYGRSGDYGEPQLAFLDRIPSELKGYSFTYSTDPDGDERILNTENVEWF